MSSITTRNTSGVSVIAVRGAATNSGSSHTNALYPWVETTTSSTTGWVVDTTGATEGTYSAANRRSYLTDYWTAGTATTNLTVAYSATTDNASPGAVQWGLPRLGNATLSNTKLITVFAPASQ
jgi:hypothetical protein